MLDRARAKLDADEPVLALHLAEAVLAAEPDHPEARAVALAAHQALVATADGDNFWLGGWLRDQITGLTG